MKALRQMWLKLQGGQCAESEEGGAGKGDLRGVRSQVTQGLVSHGKNLDCWRAKDRRVI